jgi:hypothetical protein
MGVFQDGFIPTGANEKVHDLTQPNNETKKDFKLSA